MGSCIASEAMSPTWTGFAGDSADGDSGYRLEKWQGREGQAGVLAARPLTGVTGSSLAARECRYRVGLRGICLCHVRPRGRGVAMPSTLHCALVASLGPMRRAAGARRGRRMLLRFLSEFRRTQPLLPVFGTDESGNKKKHERRADAPRVASAVPDTSCTSGMPWARLDYVRLVLP